MQQSDLYARLVQAGLSQDQIRAKLKQAQQRDLEEHHTPIILKRWAHAPDGRLTGCAYGHPNFRDGEHVVTSRVQWIDEQIGMARTLNTVYILREKA